MCGVSRLSLANVLWPRLHGELTVAILDIRRVPRVSLELTEDRVGSHTSLEVHFVGTREGGKDGARFVDNGEEGGRTRDEDGARVVDEQDRDWWGCSAGATVQRVRQ